MTSVAVCLAVSKETTVMPRLEISDLTVRLFWERIADFWAAVVPGLNLTMTWVALASAAAMSAWVMVGTELAVVVVVVVVVGLDLLTPISTTADKMTARDARVMIAQAWLFLTSLVGSLVL